MKIDEATVNILKNFSTINPSILIEEGNVLATIAPTKAVLAKATVSTNFTKRFAIYNLTQFLGLCSIIENPDFEFGDTSVTACNESKTTACKYAYADESTIMIPTKKQLTMPTADVSIEIKDTSFRDVIRAAGTFGLPEIAFTGDGVNAYIQALDSKNPGGNSYSIKIGETNKTFRAIFKTENLIKILSGDYKIDISSQGISYFKGANVEYWIAVEAKSSTF
jgi:hypothetical protein